MTAVYDSCCQRSAAEGPTFELCPECGTPLIRCASCGGLCAPDDYCVRCHELTCLVDVGRRYREGELVALRLRLANQGTRIARLTALRYGLSCGSAYPLAKSGARVLPPGELVDLVLDGMCVERSGHLALCLELGVEFGGTTFVLAGEKLLERVAAARHGGGDVNIQVDHVDKAADLNINIGGQEDGPPRDAEALEPVGLVPRPAGPGGVSRATRILIHHGEPVEPRAYYLARKPTLTLGVARPERFPQTDVCIRLHPEREGLNLECNQLMSRAHFSLRASAGDLHLIDLSTNGTTVNGTRVAKDRPCVLRDGDQVAPWLDPRLIRHRRWRLRFHRQGERVETVEWIPLGER